MKKLIFILLAVSAISGHATLTLVKREPFIGPGTLTSASPGANFDSVTGTLTLVRVGPRTSDIPAPGWSADVRTAGPSIYHGTINLSGPASLCGMWGEWVRIKALPPSGGYMSVLQLLDRNSSNVVMDFTINSNGVISTSPYNYGGSVGTFTSPAITPNTWVWLAVAWQMQSGSSYSIRCMSMPLGGVSPTIWGSADNLNAADTSFSAVNTGLQTGDNGPKVRIGCPSLYSMSNFSDIAYPSEIIPPVEQSYSWYANPVTGNDNNDGATPATAWKTADKISIESQYSGMLDSNAPGPGGGDVLTVDTSGGSLPIDSNPLIFVTQGLKVQPAPNQTYIMCQAEAILCHAAFTPTTGLTKTYQTADTQPNVVAWENDKWMWHVKSASFGAAASVTDPQTGITLSYPCTGAALDAVAGSFYTDGTQLYLHPFDDTNPKADNKVYTRSINRTQQQSAIIFLAGNYRAIGFNVRKTTLVDQNDGAILAYCLHDEVLSGSGFSSSVEGGYFIYGDKHCFGSTGNAINSTLLVLNTECEQGNPYCSYGGQSPFASYTSVMSANDVHVYRGCTCLKRSGLIGSASGDAVGTGGDIVLSHNNGAGISFASITFDNCNFASGSATMGATPNFIVTNQSQIGQINTYCANTTIRETTFPLQLVSMEPGATNLTVRNCLIKPAFTLSQAPPYLGFFVSGNVTIEGCTFDLSGIGGNASYFQQGIIQRQGPLNLTFRNNAYLVPRGEDFPLLYGVANSDVLSFDHNAYNLGSGTTLVRNYNDASLSFAQWQAMGEDCSNSSLNAALNLQGDVPQSGSPLLNAGVDLGSGPDLTCTVYAHRNTIGAYQGSGSYLAPQTIGGFPPRQEFSVGEFTLPANSDAGLPVTYSIVSGPAQISGNILTLTEWARSRSWPRKPETTAPFPSPIWRPSPLSLRPATRRPCPSGP